MIETEYGNHTVKHKGSLIWCTCLAQNCWAKRKYIESVWEKETRRDMVAHVVLPNKQKLIQEQQDYVYRMLNG